MCYQATVTTTNRREELNQWKCSVKWYEKCDLQVTICVLQKAKKVKYRVSRNQTIFDGENNFLLSK